MPSRTGPFETAWRALGEKEAAAGWNTIPVQGEDVARILAGRHFPGNEEAVLLCFEDFRLPRNVRFPSGRGFQVVKVDLGKQRPGQTWVGLVRKSEGSLDLFTTMVSDVADRMVGFHGNPPETYTLVIDRVQAWQAFMEKEATDPLGKASEQGLFGELHVLRECIRSGLPCETALQGWQGPLDGLHDFAFGPGALEVKTTTSPSGFPATISSLDQLDPSQVAPLYLAAVRLAVSESGQTLPAIAEEVRSLMTSAHARTRFEDLLLQAGYHDGLRERFLRRYMIVETRIKNVDGDFPALTRAGVPAAVTSAKYELDLDRVAAPDLALCRALEYLGVLGNGTE